MSEPTREQGRVDWFDRKLGYGFASRNDGSDVFIHVSKIMAGETLYFQTGDTVEFESRDVARRSGEKKSQAFNIKLVKSIATSQPKEEDGTETKN